MTTSLIDTHCHLDFSVFDDTREQELEACKRSNVRACLVPSVKKDNWSNVLKLSRSYSQIYAALGLHPCFMGAHKEDDLDDLKKQAVAQDIVAIGEFGLDFYLPNVNHTQQLFYFKAQLLIAKELALPVILHVRKAHDQVLNWLRVHRLERGGVIHAFSGSEQQAYQYIELGFKLGFGGAATYPRAAKLHRLLRDLPIESLLLETDAPDMPPSFLSSNFKEMNREDSGFTGKPQFNRPHYLRQIARIIAEVRGCSEDYLAEETSKNACSLFQFL